MRCRILDEGSVYGGVESLVYSPITSVFVDTVNDRLYAVSLGAIYVLSNAGTASGVVSATAVLAPPGGGFTAVAVAP